MGVWNAPQTWDDHIMADEISAGDKLAMRRRRLRFRAWHRGTREVDLMLGPFCDARCDSMPAAELDRLEALMGEPDPDLARWLLGGEEPPAHVDRRLIGDIRAFLTSGEHP